MNLELIGIFLAMAGQFIGLGYYFGKLNSRLDIIEQKIESILDAVLGDKVLKMSDFRKNKH